ncbi:sperm flagellar protein 1 [Pipra filicauda]|uniref:Sperm flagellar protein 1 n=1 Tax=Pipra filicauda TaxID=649802 RepID=A0A7R5KF02_9PASS|nr:sperm flagellar protein 1 [Pipra filicauda]
MGRGQQDVGTPPQPVQLRGRGRGRCLSPHGLSRPRGVPKPPGGVPGDAAMRLQLVEREQALRLARETIQILQAKVERLEQLLLLKNLRIDDLSRRLQQGRGQGQAQGRGQGRGQQR